MQITKSAVGLSTKMSIDLIENRIIERHYKKSPRNDFDVSRYPNPNEYQTIITILKNTYHARLHCKFQYRKTPLITNNTNITKHHSMYQKVSNIMDIFHGKSERVAP